VVVTKLKTRMNILAIISAFLVLAFTIYYFAVFNNTTVIEVHGFYEGYNSAQSLYDDAELVIIGKPTKDFYERDHHATYTDKGINPLGSVQDFYTITNIAVEEVVKGEVQNISTIDNY
jgi:hypothetical protein